MSKQMKWSRNALALMLTLTSFGALTACSEDSGRNSNPKPDGMIAVVDASAGNDAAVVSTDAGNNNNNADFGNCSELVATIRDFHKTHPDFEHFTSDMVTPGIVQSTLGTDGKPVYAPAGATICTTGAAEFAQWYNDVPNVNVTLPVTLALTESSPGVFVYDNPAFFPVDNLGFGNEGFNHNFSFTTEIHTSFIYKGGETFTFRGDDDLWMFVNGKLAIDLGGLHQPAMGTVSLDAKATELGIVVGGSYKMDIFHAERHSTASNFRIETTIDCFIIQ
jgi:fibro-slime domain-containing protein